MRICPGVVMMEKTVHRQEDQALQLEEQIREQALKQTRRLQKQAQEHACRRDAAQPRGTTHTNFIEVTKCVTQAAPANSTKGSGKPAQRNKGPPLHLVPPAWLLTPLSHHRFSLPHPLRQTGAIRWEHSRERGYIIIRFHCILAPIPYDKKNVP
ncbi:hypothetical protein EVAR_76725_1 [Eumeta japonica]|uniref:Uncharacterized protein n=1 Tax=Eumeta variegata TaxID=151549 RepID=A0A4C1STJ4_EUMVA|nr:hypothetical protein EVAR_76725_1 [Eumeta japonica]